MTEEADFLAVIREDPDDDDARLVFADWLEERGDPRSEYLRVMVSLAARERAGRASPTLRQRLIALSATINLKWRENVGIRYEVVLARIDAATERVCLTLAALAGITYPEAVATAARAPVVVATLILEEADRFARSLELARLGEPRVFRSRARSPVCRVLVRWPGRGAVPRA